MSEPFAPLCRLSDEEVAAARRNATRTLVSPQPWIKVCGVTSPEAARAIAETGVDWIGAVHFPPSPRHVPLETVREISHAVRGSSEMCVLLVDPDDALFDEVLRVLGPDDVIQLHGRETRERVDELRLRHPIDGDMFVKKAIGVASAADLEALAAYEDWDMVVIDAKPPAGADRPGGHGRPFDWTILKALGRWRTFMLSGGLTPQNVGEAIRVAKPNAVDVSSGVETAPGIKDIRKVEAFVAAVNAAAPEVRQSFR